MSSLFKYFLIKVFLIKYTRQSQVGVDTHKHHMMALLALVYKYARFELHIDSTVWQCFIQQFK